MSEAVTIAVIGGTTDQGPGDPIPESELSRHYRDRRSVDLEVDADTSLGDLLAEAASRLDVPEWAAKTPAFNLGLHRPEDATGTPHTSQILALVDERGHAYWKAPVNDVTYGELLRAVDAGATPGDPRRLHFSTDPMIGNGVLPGWPEIIELYGVLREVVEVLGVPGTLYASYEALKRWRRRSEVAVEALPKHADDWQQRGGGPQVLEQWLDDHAWNSSTVGRLLDCSPQEAEAVLWAFGFGRQEDGMWRRACDEEAKLMDGTRTLFLHMAVELASKEELRAALRGRIEVALKTGRAPAPPSGEELPWLRRLSRPPSRLQRLRWRIRSWWDGLRGR